jgi:hypothetical protein
MLTTSAQDSTQMTSPGKRVTSSSPGKAHASTKTEADEFLQSFNLISEALYQELGSYNLPENGIEWFKQMFKETVPGGTLWLSVMLFNRLMSIIDPLRKDE